MLRSMLLSAALLFATNASASPVPSCMADRQGFAGLQVAQIGSTQTPSFGYQPYNDRNPTGFSHPQGMGYGSYYMEPKLHGHRFKALNHRRFRGY